MRKSWKLRRTCPPSETFENPMRRVGPKGVGVDSFEPVSWSEALDEVAAKFSELAWNTVLRRFGHITTLEQWG